MSGTYFTPPAAPGIVSMYPSPLARTAAATALMSSLMLDLAAENFAEIFEIEDFVGRFGKQLTYGPDSVTSFHGYFLLCVLSIDGNDDKANYF